MENTHIKCKKIKGGCGMEKTNKTQLIKKHLIEKGNITSWEAINLYGETRLSDVVYRLKQRGMDIVTLMIDDIDRNGNTNRYAKYIYKGRIDG